MESVPQLLKRIARSGISAGYLKRVLPSWVADYPPTDLTGMLELKIHLARELGIDLHSLEESATVAFGPLPETTRYKRRVTTTVAKLRPSTAMYFSLAKAILAATTKEYVPVPNSALQIREEIHQRSQLVTLNTLLRYFWAHGIPVVHYSDFPTGLAHPFATAINIDGRPVVIVGSTRKENAWHAFHLAHELGHIACGHLQNGDIIVDVEEGAPQETDIQEQEADRFAIQLLAGNTEIAFPPGNASTREIVQWARQTSGTKRIDAGHLILRHAFSSASPRWERATLALQTVESGADASRTINHDHALRHLNKSEISDDRLAFLDRVLATSH